MSCDNLTYSINDQDVDVTCMGDRPWTTLDLHQSDPMTACAIYTAQLSHSPQHFMSMYAQTVAMPLSSVKKQPLIRQLLRHRVSMCLFQHVCMCCRPELQMQL